MLLMIARHLTQVVFWSALLLSIVSVALAYLKGELFLVLLALSLGFNVWSVLKSEREGFVRSTELRRTYEPARHFNAAQMVIVVSLIMAQIVVAVLILID